MIIAILCISITLNFAFGFFLVRFSRRLLQFDAVWQSALPVLFEYAEDLRKMVSSDLLIDNPDVIRFHKRNQRALLELDSITESVRQRMQSATRDKKFPRPDVE